MDFSFSILRYVLNSANGYSARFGREYYANGAVTDLIISPTFIQAEVQGTDSYEVQITEEGDCSCTCWSHHYPCKHIVAVALAAIDSYEQSLVNEKYYGRLYFLILPKEEKLICVPVTQDRQGVWHPVTTAEDFTKLQPSYDEILYTMLEDLPDCSKLDLNYAFFYYHFMREESLQTGFIDKEGNEITVEEAKQVSPYLLAKIKKESLSFRKPFALVADYYDDWAKEKRTQPLYTPSGFVGASYNPETKTITPYFSEKKSALIHFSGSWQPFFSFVKDFIANPRNSYLTKEQVRYILNHTARHCVLVAQFLPQPYGKQMGVKLRLRYGYAKKRKVIDEIIEAQQRYLHSPVKEGLPAYAEKEDTNKGRKKVFDRTTPDLFLADQEESILNKVHGTGYYVELISYHILLLRKKAKEYRLRRKARETIRFRLEEMQTEISPNRVKSIFKQFLIPLIELGAIIQLDPKVKDLVSKTTIQMEIRPGQIDNWFEALLQIPGFTQEDVELALDAYYANREYVKLKNNRVVLLANTGLDAFLQKLQLHGAKIDKKGKITNISKASLIALELEKEYELKYTKDLQAFQKKMQVLQESKYERINPPKEFKAKLRPYQKQGLNFLYHLYKNEFGGILADDMGLGKTVQVLSLIATVQKQDRSKKFLVVAPVAALYVWKGEVEKFCPFLRTYMWHGANRTKEGIEKCDIVLTTYGTLVADKTKALHHVSWDSVFIDESQAIKNPNTKAYKAVAKLKTKRFFALTGTPLENYTMDLWAIFNIIVPGLLGGRKLFTKYFDSRPTDETNRQLAKRIAPFILRRKKDEVLKDLPPKTEQHYFVEMPYEQATVYEALRQKAMHDLEAGAGSPIAIILKYIVR
ncbi:MAG: hypothetical protein D6767_05285, partial [Candidatus Hydrogenedentota bacterium]